MTKRYRCQINKVKYYYPSLTAAARAWHIPAPVVRGRLRLGWRPGKALSEPLAFRKPSKYVPHPDVVRHAQRVAKANASQTRH